MVDPAEMVLIGGLPSFLLAASPGFYISLPSFACLIARFLSAPSTGVREDRMTVIDGRVRGSL